jgi:hypothetical protein
LDAVYKILSDRNLVESRSATHRHPCHNPRIQYGKVPLFPKKVVLIKRSELIHSSKVKYGQDIVDDKLHFP